MEEPVVISLTRQDLSPLSNKELCNRACQEKAVFQSYIEGHVVNQPVIIRYPDDLSRDPLYFPKMNFLQARFVRAIEGYLISTCRHIAHIAPQRGLTTAVNQIFGKGVLELIEMDHLPVESRFYPGNTNRDPLFSDVPVITAKQETASAVIIHLSRFAKG